MNFYFIVLCAGTIDVHRGNSKTVLLTLTNKFKLHTSSDKVIFEFHSITKLGFYRTFKYSFLCGASFCWYYIITGQNIFWNISQIWGKPLFGHKNTNYFYYHRQIGSIFYVMNRMRTELWWCGSREAMHWFKPCNQWCN